MPFKSFGNCLKSTPERKRKGRAHLSRSLDGAVGAEHEEEQAQRQHCQTEEDLGRQPGEVLLLPAQGQDPDRWHHVGDVGGGEGADEVEDGPQRGDNDGDQDGDPNGSQRGSDVQPPRQRPAPAPVGRLGLLARFARKPAELAHRIGGELTDGVDMELEAREDAEHHRKERHHHVPLLACWHQIQDQRVLLIVAHSECQHSKDGHTPVEHKAKACAEDRNLGHPAHRRGGCQLPSELRHVELVGVGEDHVVDGVHVGEHRGARAGQEEALHVHGLVDAVLGPVHHHRHHQQHQRPHAHRREVPHEANVPGQSQRSADEDAHQHHEEVPSPVVCMEDHLAVGQKWVSILEP